MERVKGQAQLRNGHTLSLDLFILVVILVVFILASGTPNSATGTTHPTPVNSTSSTTNETLCIEGYLPDGTYWSCT